VPVPADAQTSPVFAILMQLGYILALSRKRKYGIKTPLLRVVQIVDSSLEADARIAEEARRVETLRSTLHGAASVASFEAAVLTEMYLCNVNISC
jgi:hypothetical protein